MSSPWEERARRASVSPGVINLGGGLPSEAQFPRKELAASFLRVVSAPRSAALQYGWAEGQASLRARIAARLNARGARVAPDDVLITNGAQQALSLATQLISRRGGTIGVEAATYPAALDLFRQRGITPVSLEAGRAHYVMTVSNPLGQPLAPEARAAVLAAPGAIIEDDAYGDLLFTGKSPPLLLAESPERTYHIGTFSKTLCPGLRVGWLVAPPSRRDRARRLKEAEDLQANSLSQAVVSDFLAHDAFEERLAVLRRFYRARAGRLARAVRRALPSWEFQFPAGGFCLWIQADARADERRFLEAALREGVSFDAGSSFEPRRRANQPARLRLCFSFEAPARFEDGARRLARAWARVHAAKGRMPRRRG